MRAAKMVPLHQRAENVGQQKIGNGFQLIAGRRMSGDLHAQLAQLLHRAPDFRARLVPSSSAMRVPLMTTVALSLSRRTMRPRRASVEPSCVGVDASWRYARDSKIMQRERVRRERFRHQIADQRECCAR